MRTDPNLVKLGAALAGQDGAIEQQRQLAGLTSEFASPSDLVKARLDGDGYRSQLGLMRQVHLDLRDLSESLHVDANDPNYEKKVEKFPRGPARVVLFIDDLDRCPPNRVVEVFEAIQLLLSTSLFVVVVALDLRYVSRSLEKVYSGVLNRWGEPSGLDYIEKIIQIPYRTRHIEPSALERFLAAQVLLEKASEDVDAAADSPPADPSPLVAASPSRTRDDTSLEAAEPRALEFTHEELTVMRTCCEFVALSPRSVKRLVNVSKLLKLIWSRSDRPELTVDPFGTMVMLVALSGAHPEVMRGAFQYLERCHETKETAVLIELLERYILPEDEVALTHSHKHWCDDVAKFRAPDAIQGASFAFGNRKLGDMPGVLSLVGAFCFVGDVGSDGTDKRTA